MVSPETEWPAPSKLPPNGVSAFPDRDPVFTRNGDIAGQNRGNVGDFLRLFGKPSEFPAGCDLISAANERRLSRGRFTGIGLIQLGNIGVCGFIGGIGKFAYNILIEGAGFVRIRPPSAFASAMRAGVNSAGSSVKPSRERLFVSAFKSTIPFSPIALNAATIESTATIGAFLNLNGMVFE